MTTRLNFDNSLEELRCKIAKLSSMVQERIQQSVQSLVSLDKELANQVVVGDLEVNDLQAEIEERCMFLIATQQPFARDLRKIVAGFKISINLERMGDLAVDIAKVNLRIGTGPLIKPLIDIPHMSEKVRIMISQGLEAYVKEDELLARQMSKMD
ncbi:MAG TPA: PhoU domain-containing protein, partial [Verrucomicrobiae bacterium]|nr:PhoU domain-containing protein [Verrucomicrobiae bacterium]